MRTWTSLLVALPMGCNVYGATLVEGASGAAGKPLTGSGGEAGSDTAGAPTGTGGTDLGGMTGASGAGPSADAAGPPQTDGPAGASSNDGEARATDDAADVGKGDASSADVSVNTSDAGAVCQPGTCKRVFVSSVAPVKSGKLGGVPAMDTFCQTSADANGLGGSWKAWLSDTTTSPSVRLTHAMVPYKLLNGSVVANDWTALTSGTLAHAINVFEDGSSPEAGVNLEVWTGTTTAGIYSGSACGNWTNDTAASPFADVGASSEMGAGWTSVYQQFCNRTTLRVYCFEQ